MPASPDDYELMARIESRDAAAFELLYDRYAGLVFTLGMRILHNRQEAEELVSDVFLEIWRVFNRYDAARGAPMTYLVTLARSRAIDRRRSAGSRPQSTVSTDLAPQTASLDPDPPANAVLVENAQRVRVAMDQLDPTLREAVGLAFFEGLTHSQVAERLNKPLGTVKTYIRQGLIRLRDSLRKD